MGLALWDASVFVVIVKVFEVAVLIFAEKQAGRQASFCGGG